MIKKKVNKKLIIIVIIIMIALLWLISYFIFVQKNHEYYCDKFILHVDSREIDLKQLNPDIISVVELLPITKTNIAIMCRVNEDTNYLMIYNFKKKDFVFSTYGSQMAWVQDDLNSFLFLDNDNVYNMVNEVIYQAPEDKHIEVIEYIGTDFMVTLTDMDYSNPRQIQIK